MFLKSGKQTHWPFNSAKGFNGYSLPHVHGYVACNNGNSGNVRKRWLLQQVSTARYEWNARFVLPVRKQSQVKK